MTEKESPYSPSNVSSSTEKPTSTSAWNEDLLAILIGGSILVVSLLLTSAGISLSGWFAKPGGWTDSPLAAFTAVEKPGEWRGIVGVFFVGLLCFAAGQCLLRRPIGTFCRAFVGVFLLGVLAYVLAGQSFVKQYNLEYALWALAAGLLISNTIGTPSGLQPAMRTEFYVKTGLVLLGGEILMSRLMALGLPGVFVAWVVTPIVLITTYWFGQRVLKIRSKSLNMVISADMSVCGVSAAIASAAACKAKKEELSLAIGMSLSFTVAMMIAMPAVIRAVGIDDQLGGAWMGGTIDATGAVAAAGEFLGEDALEVAATVKMIQNILIGVIAFGIAVYWTTVVEKSNESSSQRISFAAGTREVWLRFPKFILGFILASIVCSMIHGWVTGGPEIVETSIKSCTKVLRGWFFCLAFVSIGLETNFRDLAKHLAGGKPVLLYLFGQTLNLILTLAMAYLMFKVVFA